MTDQMLPLATAADHAHARFSADVQMYADVADEAIRARGLEQARCDLQAVLLNDHRLRVELAALAAYAFCAYAEARADTGAGTS